MMTKHENIGKFNMILSTLDELIDEDHRIRKYDKCLDWNFIYPLVEDLYSSVGKPSIDPIVLFKIVFINYVEGIHSIRKTCERCKTDIAYRWFLRINLDEKIPDHSTYSVNLKRKFLGTSLFEEIFYTILKQAYAHNFIDPENVFGDSTHVKANANKKKGRDKVIRSTESLYISDLNKDINLDRLKNGKKPITFDDTQTPNSTNTEECDDKLIKASDEDEVIATTENEFGETISKITFDEETGEITEKSPNIKYKHIKESITDPDSGYYHKGEHEKIYAYSASALCDKNGFILDTYIDAGNKHDSITFKSLYENYKKNPLFSFTKMFVLDSGYKSPSVAKTVFSDNKDLLVPYKRPMTKDGFFKKYEFVYDEYLKGYLCPNDQVLKYSTTNKTGYREFKSNPLKCKDCPYLSKCTLSKNHVKVISEHIWNDYTEMSNEIRYKIGSKEIYAKRKETIERCFADGKENFGGFVKIFV